VRLAACRALKDWDLAEHIARTLIKREPENVMHVVALAEVMGNRERAGRRGGGLRVCGRSLP
jgi:hypothetical protein